MSGTRIERDPLGELPVPADALYGIQTERARQNFPISQLLPLAPFVNAVVWIKKAAALTHKQSGRLDPKLADAIVRAADEVLAGEHRHQFVVDPYQAGAGTSHQRHLRRRGAPGRPPYGPPMRTSSLRTELLVSFAFLTAAKDFA